MAISTTQTLRAAIESPARTPVVKMSAWLDGPAAPPVDLSAMVVDWSVDWAVSESSDRLSMVSGTMAAEATITLYLPHPTTPGGTDRLSTPLLPYITTDPGWMGADYGIGMQVRLESGFITKTGPETVPVFTGRVDRVAVSEDGVITLTCLDFSAMPKAHATIPPMYFHQIRLSHFSLIEYVARSAGLYRTQPAPTGTVLSVPGGVPEIGTAASSIRLNTGSVFFNSPGNYQTVSTGTYLAAGSLAFQPSGTVIQGWWKESPVRDLLTVGKPIPPHNANESPALMLRSLTGRFDYQVTGQGWQTISNSIKPSQRYYVRFEITRRSAGEWLVKPFLDGKAIGSFFTTYDLSAASKSQLVDAAEFEGLMIVHGDPATIPSGHNFKPTLTYAPMSHMIPSIRGIPRGQDGDAADLIGAIATSTGARVFFNERGEIAFRNGSDFAASRAPHPSRMGQVIDSSRALTAAAHSYTAASRLRSAVIGWISPELSREGPVYTATDEITAPPGRSAIPLETEQTVISTIRMVQSDTPTARQSAYQAVYSYQVGDPAAAPLDRVRVAVYPSADGLILDVFNPYGRPISFWSPVTMAPALQVAGVTLNGTDPQTFTQTVNPAAIDDYVRPPSIWQQNEKEARQYLEWIASDSALPAMVFSDLVTVSDPTVQVGDNIVISDPRVLPQPTYATVVGKHAGEAEDTLTVRANWAPTGAVLDYRGKLDENALLPV